MKKCTFAIIYELNKVNSSLKLNSYMYKSAMARIFQNVSLNLTAVWPWDIGLFQNIDVQSRR